MRIEEISLEKYGVFDKLTLPIGETPELIIVYGPNEAGKSTLLSAVSDFLFGFPHSSPYGRGFGQDQMRLAATIRMSDGQVHSLRRRKGRSTVKTLTSEANQPVDEGLLSGALGATTRERFEVFFGLSHASLRSGGEGLLAADGDIGRLIVEAGGGLRHLTSSLISMRSEAAKLFTIRRAADREFYKAWDTYDAAERQISASLLTRDDFEKVRASYDANRETLEQRRGDRRRLEERATKQQRLVRVIPLLKDVADLESSIATYADLPLLRETFATEVKEALSAHREALAALVGLAGQHDDLEAQVGNLVVSDAMITAEPDIRDIDVRSTHVTKARDDRPNRKRELEEFETSLSALRRSVGLGDDVPIEDRLPAESAIARVQALIGQGVDLPTKIQGLKGQIVDDSAALTRLQRRQEARTERGQHKPFGVSVGDVSGLAIGVRALEAKRRQHERVTTQIDARLTAVGFSNVAVLSEFQCPDVAAISGESQRRAAATDSLARHAEAIAVATALAERHLAEVERLRVGGDLPSPTAIAAVRAARRDAWLVIRGAILDAKVAAWAELSSQQREACCTDVERLIEEADSLADRRFAASQRLAALEFAEKERSEALASVEASQVARTESETRIAEMTREWLHSWPASEERERDLGRLRMLVEERAAILHLVESAQHLHDEVELLAADVEPRLQMLAIAEEHLGLSPQPEASLASRLQLVTQGILEHDGAYADFVRDLAMRSDTVDLIGRRRDDLAGFEEALAKWRADWTIAVRELLLEGDVTPERGNAVATQWAAASGVVLGRLNTIRRLSRMDDDEEALRLLVSRVGAIVGITLPTDAVAGAQVLLDAWAAAHKVQIERASVVPQLERLTRDRAKKQAIVDGASARVVVLADEAKIVSGDLPAFAARLSERTELSQRRNQSLEALARAGDGYSPTVLSEQRAGRDFDELVAELKEIEEGSRHLDQEIEQALSAVQDAKRNLDQFMSTEGVTRASAEREGAIAELHGIVTRYVELGVASDLLAAAIERIRIEQQDPLVSRAGDLLAISTAGALAGIETDVNGDGKPVVVGRRSTGERVPIDEMSDGTRDQLFLAFRLASIERYCHAAEALPFIGDDLLVHFDDQRTAVTLEVLAEISKTTQVLLFTHHRRVCEAATALVASGAAKVVDLTNV